MDTNETTIYAAILITGIVIGTILLYFAITIYRSHRKHFKLLTRQFKAEMELLEKERSRIASDLHDELGPLLALTKIHINAIENGSADNRSHLEIAENNIDTLTERFSGIAKNLTPKVLVSRGLKEALEDFVEQYEGMTQLNIELHYNLKRSIDMLQALHIYRIIQELIHNAVKHSEATHLRLQLAQKKNRLYILYNDNGTGIQHLRDSKNGGLGLESLKNRAEMLGGKMSCYSLPQKGTEYFFEIPLGPVYEKNNKNSNS